MAIKIPKKRSQDDRDEEVMPDVSRDELETDNTEYKRQKVEEDVETPEMQNQLRKSIENAKFLPIAKYKNHILNKLRTAKVLVIEGQTGCGKTTQVPKFILEGAQAQNQEVNIICT